MDKNWIELLSLFDQHGVRYLIVGGYAVIFYGQPRGTKDLDLFIDSARQNAEAVYTALVKFGAPMAGMSVEDFEDASSVYQIGQPPLRVDVICGLEGTSFEQVWEARVESLENGVPVFYIGLKDLIANKLSAGRLQDLADAEALHNSLKAQGKTP